MINISPLRPQDIPFLAEKATLYISDYRAISESMEYEIPAMWKYENALVPIIQTGSIAVNQYASPNENTRFAYLIAKTVSDPRVSIFRRLNTLKHESINKIWVAIPHPDADVLARDWKCDLSYSYKNFLISNNKIRQKELFADQTPNWHVLKKADEIGALREKKFNGFLKRSLGSGGYTVFPLENTVNNEALDRLLTDGGYEWYVEERIEGIPCSIQCVSYKNGDITIFGFSEQKIADGTRYIGSSFKRLQEIIPIQDQLEKLLDKIGSLLRGYEGFFGIDFILSDARVCALEANIRLTEATVPTLIFNCHVAGSGEYLDEIAMADVLPGDIPVLVDHQTNAVSLLRILS